MSVDKYHGRLWKSVNERVKIIEEVKDLEEKKKIAKETASNVGFAYVTGAISEEKMKSMRAHINTVFDDEKNWLTKDDFIFEV
ncbi:MAG: hypothetical protein V3R57_03325 [Candidatus Bathyarchaeia archaeon]